MSEGGYDFSSTVYSQDGRVMQVDYAKKAAASHSPCIGAQCKDAVILLAQNKFVSGGLRPNANRIIYPIHGKCIITYTGFHGDAMYMVQIARQESAQYKGLYDEDIPTAILAKKLASMMHEYTCYGSVRPMGCTLLIAGFDPLNSEKPLNLYGINPAGEVNRFFATAVGKDSNTSITKLGVANVKDMQSDECLRAMIKTIAANSSEDSQKKWVLDISIIKNDGSETHHLDPKVVEEILQSAYEELEAQDE